MNRKKTFTFALALAMGVGGAGSAHAQATHGEHGMGGMTMRHCPMMTGMAESPAAILQHTDELGLAPDQIARLEAVRDDAVERRDLHARVGLSMARTRHAVRRVLTDELRERVRELAPDYGAAMGVNCDVCRGTAEIAWEMVPRGVSDPAEIQAAVDTEGARPGCRGA